MGLGSTRSAKPTTFVALTCFVTSVEEPSEVHILLHWIENTTLNTLRAQFALPSSALKTATTNMTARCTATTTTLRNSRSVAMAARLLFSSNLLKSFEMVPINTGTQNAT